MNQVRRILAVAGVASLAVLLTGCIKMDLDITVSGDDTISGEAVVAIQDSVAEALGTTPEELLENGDDGQISGMSDDVEPWAEGGFTGQRYTFEPLSFEEFSSKEMSVTRDGDEYVLKGSLPLTAKDLDMTEEELADPMAAAIYEDFVVDISYTFPGKIIKTNGKVDGNTVTWKAKIGEKNKLSARASAFTAEEIAAQEAAAEKAAAEEAAEEAAAEAAEASAEAVAATEAAEKLAEQKRSEFWGSLPGMIIIGAGIGLVLGLVLTFIRVLRNRRAVVAPVADATTEATTGGTDTGSNQS